MATKTTMLAASAALLGILALAACGHGHDNSKEPMSGPGGMNSGTKGTTQTAAAMAPAHWTAALDGKSEVPPTASAGTAKADVTYDPATKMLTWTVTYQGLTGPAQAAHFHGPAAPGANAGVQVDIGKMGLPSPMHGSATLTAQQESDLMAGMWYINIHTAKYPNGEIRGQVTPGAM
jgi:hypothetical protein